MTRPREPKPIGAVKPIAVKIGSIESRLVMAMSELESTVTAQRSVAESLSELVAELGVKTNTADLRHIAQGLAANSTRAALTALNVRGAADAIATVAALLEGTVQP